MIRERIKAPRFKAATARQYFDEMAARETRMPGFTDFFTGYTKALEGSELPKLHDRTLRLFEVGGASTLVRRLTRPRLWLTRLEVPQTLLMMHQASLERGATLGR